jgi:hypothetical protein
MPRFNADGEVIFDGKIGVWAFVKETPALKNSKNRDKGTIEIKSVTVNRDVMRAYLCEKVIPAIEILWPEGDERTIYIQQDNARTHVLPSDPAFIAAVAETGMDIKLMQQPANSPDTNVLDLGWFSSIQSLTLQSAPDTIQDLIISVEEAYDNYDPRNLDKVFVTLQTVLVEIMRYEGGMWYETPHMGKDKILREEGTLPRALSVEAKVYQDTLKILAGATNTMS